MYELKVDSDEPHAPTYAGRSFSHEKDEQRLHVLAAWREAPFYTDGGRAALAWCETLTLLPRPGARTISTKWSSSPSPRTRASRSHLRSSRSTVGTASRSARTVRSAVTSHRMPLRWGEAL